VVTVLRTPTRVALASAAISLAFVVVRMIDLGGPGGFVVAGDLLVDRATAPSNVPVGDGPGFDGQFYWRQSMEPFAFETGPVRGITFDRELRGSRVGYPLLAWIGSLGGREALVPWSLIGVNVLAMAALGWLGAQLALDRGRHAAWGLVISGYWGFAIVLARDLAELVAATAIFGAAVAVQRRRFALAAASAAVAPIAREQALLSVVALAVGVFIAERRNTSFGGALRSSAVVAGPPVATFVAWQVVVSAETGELPVLEARRANSGSPGVGLIATVPDWVRSFGDSLGASLPLATFVALVALVLWCLPGIAPAWRDAPWEVMLWLAGGGILLLLSEHLLGQASDQRQLYELAGWSWLIGLRAERERSWLPLLLIVPLTVVVAGFRALTI
jgi:hypothetical protein